MKSYEIDFKNDVNLKEIKKLFLGNGFLHLKNILNINEITKIKENILKEFGCLDKQQFLDRRYKPRY